MRLERVDQVAHDVRVTHGCVIEEGNLAQLHLQPEYQIGTEAAQLTTGGLKRCRKLADYARLYFYEAIQIIKLKSTHVRERVSIIVFDPEPLLVAVFA